MFATDKNLKFPKAPDTNAGEHAVFVVVAVVVVLVVAVVVAVVEVVVIAVPVVRVVVAAVFGNFRNCVFSLCWSFVVPAEYQVSQIFFGSHGKKLENLLSPCCCYRS